MTVIKGYSEGFKGAIGIRRVNKENKAFVGS